MRAGGVKYSSRGTANGQFKTRMGRPIGGQVDVKLLAFHIILLTACNITSPILKVSGAFVSKLRVREANYRRNRRDNLPIMSGSNSETEVELDTADMRFGKFVIRSCNIFYNSPSSAAFVNLRPIVPGHVLVVPKRVVPLLADLTAEENHDLWESVRQVQKILKNAYKASAFNVAVQDGLHAGQSVPHVHVHILPRVQGDFERNDDVYNELQEWAPRTDERMTKDKLDVPNEEDRRDRTADEMSKEAALYRNLMSSL